MGLIYPDDCLVYCVNLTNKIDIKITEQIKNGYNEHLMNKN